MMLITSGRLTEHDTIGVYLAYVLRAIVLSTAAVMSGVSIGWNVPVQLACLALILVVSLTGQTSIETRTSWSVISTTADPNQKEEVSDMKQIMKPLKKKLIDLQDFRYHHDLDDGGHLQSTNQASPKKKYRGWIMMHTLKAGGNSVEEMLNSVGYNQTNNQSLYQRGRNGGYVYFEDPAVDREWYDQYMSDWENGKDDYFTALSRDEFFRIGMVREPCDYMVSIWAFSGQGMHGFLTGRCAGNESKYNFTQFLHETIMPFQFGWLSYRVSLQLGAAGKEKIGATECPSQASAATISKIETQTANFNATEAADCWVRTENILNDLKQCLQLYASKRSVQTSMQLNNLSVLNKAPLKNNGKHKSCSDYYSNEEASAVWEREGKFAEQFGYSGCCKGLEFVPPHLI